MKIIINFLSFVFLLFVFSGCGAGKELQKETEGVTSSRVSSNPQSLMTSDNARPSALRNVLNLTHGDSRETQFSAGSGISGKDRDFLDELAEIERAGSWIQGMALTESGVRENAGDYAGAVTAAFKELAWAYGRGLIKKHEAEQGVLNVLSVTSEEKVIIAANALLSFLKENWDEASLGLEALFGGLALDEPDAFCRWMILVCALEKNSGVSSAERRRAGEAYKSIRARYAHFPEYWYRGARAFSGAIAAAYSENCINSASQGPFAEECRAILASHTGLKSEDGIFIKTKTEIDSIISQSINSSNPQFLNSLMPLINLPDNPYTVYAVGALRALNGAPVFRDYFNGQASSAKGRLAERLSYICRS